MSSVIWLAPTFSALFLYGIGQGLVKKYSADVSPAHFCIYLVMAKALVNISFFCSQTHPSLFDPEGVGFVGVAILAYLMDGAAWILYFESIVAGPITIVGTLSAAYPALTVLFARAFLAETLSSQQYLGVLLVILGCVGLSYSPFDTISPGKGKRWIPLATMALILWGLASTMVKYSYQLPLNSEANLALLNTLGGLLTLGTYGFVKGIKEGITSNRWVRSFLPMAMMAAGDLAVIIATRTGPVSVVAPLSGAYPVVTLAFAYLILKEKISRIQWACVGSILAGMFLCPGG